MDKGKGLRTQKKGKAGAGRGQGKAKKLSLLGPTALARGEPSCLGHAASGYEKLWSTPSDCCTVRKGARAG